MAIKHYKEDPRSEEQKKTDREVLDLFEQGKFLAVEPFVEQEAIDFVTRKNQIGGPMLEDQLPIIVDEIQKMLLEKNADYGDSNLVKFGTHGIAVRISDKLERILHMLKSGKDGGEVGEKEEQEWLDIAGYAIQAVRLKREEDGET